MLIFASRCSLGLYGPAGCSTRRGAFQGFKGPPLARECIHSMTCLLNLLLFERASMI